jgi:hypothetical protein
MDANRFNQSLKNLASAVNRREALHAFTAIGAALLAACGVRSAAAADSHHHRGKHDDKKNGNPGPQFTTVRVVGNPSPVLGTHANDEVSSVVGCDPGQLLSCGWRYDVSPDLLVKTVSHVLSPDASDLTYCQAFLSRTESVADPAGQIVAIAHCRQ